MRLLRGSKGSGAHQGPKGGHDASLPRVVLVYRATTLERLRHRHGTKGQARFMLRAAGQETDFVEKSAADVKFQAAMQSVESAIPADQRRTRVERELLDRFLFEPDDLVIVVGQDGLVPNTAKYLDGQLTFGVNPNPEEIDGVLCRHSPGDVGRLLAWCRRQRGGYAVEERTMAVAETASGQRLLALNEFFIGHRSHQSARYRIHFGESVERQSSSGLICATGTGASGWARSICLQRELEHLLPGAVDRRLAFFVREPFPSIITGTSIDHGVVSDAPLVLESEMTDGGVVFADGIEHDWLDFRYGERLTIRVAERRLHLVVPSD